MDYLLNIKRVCDFAPKNATVPVMGMVYINDGHLCSSTYAGGGICKLPKAFQNISCLVEAQTFWVAINSLGVDCAVARKDDKLVMSNGRSQVKLGIDTKDKIIIDVPDVPSFELSKDAHEAVLKVLPYCGHKKEQGQYGLVYCKQGEVFTTDGNAFCSRKSGTDAEFEIHGQSFAHIYPGDLIGTTNNGIVYVKSDGFWGKISNPLQSSAEKKLRMVIEQTKKFDVSFDFDGNDFVSAVQMMSKLACSYLILEQGKIKGVDAFRQEVFANDFPYEDDRVILASEYAQKIAASCRATAVTIYVGPKSEMVSSLLVFKTEDCDVFCRSITQ